jgi:hypothetical protein
MSESLFVASMMVCKTPKYFGHRLILSGCDAVWDAVETLPEELKNYFTDELGNNFVEYGGFLQMTDQNALNLLAKRELFACFRCILKEYIEYVQTCPPSELYRGLTDDLTLVGWDVSSCLPHVTVVSKLIRLQETQ